MTTITVNSDATQITVTNPELNTSLLSLQIDLVEVGCSQAATSISLFSKIATITSNSFTVNVSEIFSTKTRFDDGVYMFQISYSRVIAPEPETIKTTTKTCVLIDYLLKCKMLTQEQQILYKSLLYAEECDSCNCSKMCEIYNFLTTTPNGTSDCGCN